MIGAKGIYMVWADHRDQKWEGRTGKGKKREGGRHSNREHLGKNSIPPEKPRAISPASKRSGKCRGEQLEGSLSQHLRDKGVGSSRSRGFRVKRWGTIKIIGK